MSYVSSLRLPLLTLLLASVACAPESDPAGATRQVTVRPAAFGEGPAQTCPTGGYFTMVYVDPATTLAGDGWHFTRITDAIVAVRAGRVARGEKTLAAAACRITIEVAPGTYTGGFTASATQEVFPLVLDVPLVTLEGGLRMALDVNGRATGAAIDESQVSVLQPSAPMTTLQALIIVTDQSSGLVTGGGGDTHGDSVTVHGFELRSGFAAPDPSSAGGGFGIFAMRAQGLDVEENRFGFLIAAAVDARSTTARIALNSAADLGNGICAFCLGGPGNYVVTGNSVARSGQVGVFVLAATLSPTPAGVKVQTVTSAATVVSTIDNNAISGEQRHPVGTAIRLSAIGQGAAVGAIPGHQTTATVTSNDLTDNRFGLIADAGFPPKNTSTTTPSGNLSLTLGGNHFSGSCQADLLVSLARHTRGLGVTTALANAGYVKNSAWNITLGGNLAWSDVWYSHPAADTGVTLNNTLTVDGALVDNGARSAYDGTDCHFVPSASAWIGLKNSDDVGTKFDLLTEIKRNGVLVASGQLNGVNGGSSGFNNAAQQTIVNTISNLLEVDPGEVLSVTISARIAEGVAGHTSGTARLWYGDGSALSRVTTLADTLSKTYYLGKDTGLTLTDAPGTSRQSIDVLVNKNNGNPWKAFGTWSRTMP